MEHFLDWLMVMLKALHLPFLAGWYVKLNSQEQQENDFYDIGIMGDNVPYVFLK